MNITKIVSNLLDSNVYVLEKDGEIILVDCGVEFESVEQVISGKKVLAVLLTHGHNDHCKYCNDYAERLGVKIYANEKIKSTMTDKEAIYSDDGSTINEFSNFVFLSEDCSLKIGEFIIYCYPCSGHCQCCECYLIDGNLFAGDVLFERSIGRIDLKTSNKEEMLSSLNKLEKLDFKTVYSGHGDSTSYEQQMKNIKAYKRFLTR